MSSVRLLFVLLLSLILVVTMFGGMAHHMIFYPMRYPAGNWAVQDRIGAEDLWLHAADGVKLHGWWVPQKDARFATVFLHGNAGNVTHRAVHALSVNRAGSSVLLLDYRGYGKSEGRPTETGVYADADASYDDVRAHGFPPERIILHGESLGTAVAVDLAVRKACAGVVLEAPLESLRKMAGAVLPVVGPMFVRGFDTRTKIRGLRVPLLVIHGDRDDVVPFSQGQAVFEAAPEPKSFWRIPKAHHNDFIVVAGEQYVERLRAFYRTLEPGR
jgi:fermentation-respiration switch protein FrsA (DUF1100 family)